MDRAVDRDGETPAAPPAGGAPHAVRLAQDLERAGRSDTPTAEAAALDAASIATLREAERPERLLERLEPETFGRLLAREAERLGEAPDDEHRRRAWDLLDLARSPALLQRIAPGERQTWADRLLALVDASHLTVGPLFRQRAERYGTKTLFELTTGGRLTGWSWRRAAARVELLARGLHGLGATGEPRRVAILSENRVEMALLDLACLTSGLVDVLVPANATESDVRYILGHCGADTVIVSGPEQLRKVLKHRDGLSRLRRIVAFDPPATRSDGVLSLDDVAAAAERAGRPLPRERSAAVRSADLATVMYTSGTTGTPKGIQFSHRNIVFKRFARALALPEIGDEDVFLCFLPLYHTFGRYLELLGCVFWGATYCFLESTSPEGLEAGMGRYRPTAFISVPKKWMELHERIGCRADPLAASDVELLAATRQVTGGRLRWGLSAAGHLDPDLFAFFHRQGIELMSGFGMTEATGGVTMTPPGGYKPGSLGVPLPGIEVALADDGELLVRGPYVMLGYLDPPDGEASFDEHGWFHSGDLMERDEDGHVRLVDRKKEIYKNIKGETIAPQRVENLFRDFESVGRAFLVGDHREYNTLLIHPNPDYKELDLHALPEGEVRSHFRSLVVSVNRFLAPYERIVDFALIPRDLDPARGELTAKGTPRRKVVEQSFAPLIQQMYRRTRLSVGGAELTVPNWLFQLLGLTAQDILFGAESIMLPSAGTRLSVEIRAAGLTRVGSCLYRHPAGPLNLGALLTAPRLWLGNEELVRFVPLDPQTRQRSDRADHDIEWVDRTAPYRAAPQEPGELEALLARPELELMDLDLPARMLSGADEEHAHLALRVLERLVRGRETPLSEAARFLLARAVAGPAALRRRAFQVLLPAEREARFAETLRRFLLHDPAVLDEETRHVLREENLGSAKLEILVEMARHACEAAEADASERKAAGPLLALLADYGAGHPIVYRRLRAFLERMSLFARDEPTRRQAAAAAQQLQAGFRGWLEPPARLAVDPETGEEYRWEDVAVFDDGVEQADRRRLLAALRGTPFLREGAFLFSGASIRLSDIPPRGVWVRLLGTRHGKSVFRITVQTRFQGAYDLAVNVNHDLDPEQVREEIRWLILCGDPGNRDALVEDFGGYWPEQDLWSEEFIEGETLQRAMQRLSRQGEDATRLPQLWPFLAWGALAACVDFWHRTGGRLELADPSLSNVVVPTEDFQTGVRLVSVSRRRPHRGLLEMLRSFRDEFVAPAEEQYPMLRGIVGWRVIFSSVLEVLGEREGLDRFAEALAAAAAPAADIEGPLREFCGAVADEGFVPMRLHFAVERYRRWVRLSTDATPQARALTLHGLYETYGLQRLAAAHPEIRVRFFLETVFRDAHPELVAGLRRALQALRARELAPEELLEAVDELRDRHELTEEEEYFLARLSHPYLRPEDAAGFVHAELGGRRQSEIVVTLEDHDGNGFRVRHALNPKEVERLFRLFLAAKLDVRFRIEHRYLVALNDRGQIIGGIYYEIEEAGQSAHLEKIVVAERYRRKGVADGLMKEFLNRLRAAGVKTVTTGFFRPEYFYRHGFHIEKRFAGLVKSLERDEAA
jgi:long-subunit acyl-CoA synthetase (AMP-forming)/GNAT superfamily N-acetyltransferase